MHLHKISLHNFKNYPDAEFIFPGKINCIVGNNGVGKTNLLDAIHYLSFCKSYFNPSDVQNIRHEKDFFTIHGSYYRQNDIIEQLQCIQKRNQRKKFLYNKKEYDRLADHIGQFPLVMISPSDRDLINDGSELRRRYIDSVISQFDKLYLNDLINYNKALFQRNALLKSFIERRYFDPEALEIWSEQMVAFGTNIFQRRSDFLKEFIPLFQHYFSFISGGKEQVDMNYQSQLLAGSFSDLMKQAVEKDRAALYSTAGVHKDDLEFLMEGYHLKRYGSQGQQKSYVIAIKLAQFEYTRKVNGFKPILLLDDIFDKLDDHRVQQVIKLVSENSFGQVFITDTQEENVRKIFDPLAIDHKIFRINGNQSEQDQT
ncbi:MAG: DNA replication and repair protein RecF [Bacteroidia bacterium]|nr:DNA replication and repair protein RecF [Bacteroidia bacterium]